MENEKVNTDVMWLVVDESILHPNGYRMFAFSTKKEALDYHGAMNCEECFVLQVTSPGPEELPASGPRAGWLMPDQIEMLKESVEDTLRHISIGDDDA